MDERLIGGEVAYPTPWRLAETKGSYTVVVCASGHEAFSVMNPELGALIVDLVNDAGRALDSRVADVGFAVQMLLAGAASETKLARVPSPQGEAAEAAVANLRARRSPVDELELADG